MDYQDHVERLRAEYPDLADQIAGFAGLQHVLAWMRAKGLPLGSLDVIAQDEYCHDLFFPWGPDGRYLAFGMT